MWSTHLNEKKSMIKWCTYQGCQSPSQDESCIWWLQPQQGIFASFYLTFPSCLHQNQNSTTEKSKQQNLDIDVVMASYGPRLVVPIDVKKKPWEQKLPLHNRWHPDIPPVAEVTVGDVFRVEMVDFSGGGITKEYTAEDIKHANPSIVSSPFVCFASFPPLLHKVWKSIEEMISMVWGEYHAVLILTKHNQLFEVQHNQFFHDIFYRSYESFLHCSRLKIFFQLHVLPFVWVSTKIPLRDTLK